MSSDKELAKILEEDGMTVFLRTPVSMRQDFLLKIKAKQLGIKKREVISRAIDAFCSDFQQGA